MRKRKTALMEQLGSHDGMRLRELLASVNIRDARLRKALSFLENDGFIRREKGLYYITPKPYRYDRSHYDAVTAIRRREMEQMKGLMHTSLCYSRYIVSALDDRTARDCGHCVNCTGRELLPEAVSAEALRRAEKYLGGLTFPIEARKRWAKSDVTSATAIKYLNQDGLCLSRYGDPGYGELVRQGKYSRERRFCDELVGKSAELLKPLLAQHGIRHICCVPSLRSELVKDFSMRLAAALGVSFTELLEKTSAAEQKSMENSAHQCSNAYSSFFVKDGAAVPEKLLLVDDMVDSRWTLTVCGYRLMEAGAKLVVPFALADSSNREV